MKRPPETVAFLFGVKEAGQMLPLLAARFAAIDGPLADMPVMAYDDHRMTII